MAMEVMRMAAAMQKVVRVADEDSHDAMGGNHVDGLRADAYGEDRTDRRDQSEVDGDPKERLVP